MSVEHELRAVGGAARWSALRARGVPATSIRNAVKDGSIVRPAPGVYALPTAPEAQISAARFNAALTCVTAAQYWGLPVIDAVAGTHLAVPRDLHIKDTPTRPTRGVCFHRTSLPPQQAGFGMPAVMSPIAVVMHAAQCASARSAVALLDAALRAGAVLPSELGVLRSGKASHRWLAEAADARAESPLESLARLELASAHLAFECQAEIPGVGRVDFLVEGGVVVEADGREHHGVASAFAEDRRRDREAQRLGLDVARFTYADVVHKPGLVAETVKDLVDRRRRLPALRGSTRYSYPTAVPGRLRRVS